MIMYFLIATLICSTIDVAAERLTGVCTGVVDGDTLTLDVDGQEITAHLAAIDAPELAQPYGPEARDFLATMAVDQTIQVMEVAKEPSGEIQAKTRIGERDPALALLEAGLAWHDTIHNNQENLAVAEIVARSSKLGLWSDPEPVAPWLWRQQQVEVKATPKPALTSLSDVADENELDKDVDHHIVIAEAGSGSASGPKANASSKPRTSGSSGKSTGGQGNCCCQITRYRKMPNSQQILESTSYQRVSRRTCESMANKTSKQPGASTSKGCVSDSNCR